MEMLADLPVLAHRAGDWHGHGWWLIWPILFAILIGLAVWLVLRRRDGRRDPLDRAREILAERYARGELSGDEYRRRLGELQGS